MIRTTIALLATLLASPASAATGYDRATLQRDLNAIAAAGVTGVLAEVDTGSRRLTARAGVGDLRTGTPVPYNAYFRMGSNTKTFVAVVVLQLVAERKISLADTVDRWLPGVVSGNGNDGSKITVRNLLQHTSGLHNYTMELPLRSARDYLDHRFDSYDPRLLVAGAMTHPPDFQPGTSWDYSNTNYLLAGMIIKKATGREWADEVRARIIRPLGLKSTFSARDRADLPAPHSRAYTRFPADPAYVDTTVLNMTWAGAAGDMITTTADLTRFWQALLGGKLLKPAQLTEMRTTVPAVTWQETDPGMEYGLGIGRFPLSCGGFGWNHGGDLPGYATRNGFGDDGRRGIVMSQSSNWIFGPTGPVTKKAVDNVLCH
jgi:D-alanyl-D-alanine carboxypeptidase